MISPPIPKNYVPTVEDLLAIQEYFAECDAVKKAVKAKERRAREIAETDTRDEFRFDSLEETPIQLVFRRDMTFAEQVAAQLEAA